jgi:REP-associated tyrosine transposase
MEANTMTDQKNPWQTLSKKDHYDNPWIKVEEHQVINPSGNHGIYGKVSFKNKAVGIIAVDRDGNIRLVGQFRYTLNQYSWEIPEGGSPPGEDLLESAKRELREETGLTANRWSELMRLHLSNSVSDEEAIIFLAEDLTEGEAMPEDTEALAVRNVPFSEAVQMVMDGTITDSMSVAGILKAACLKLVKRHIDIVYQDDYIVVVNKPAGLLVHRTDISSDREFLLQYVRDQLKQTVHPVHRLDRPTSGLVIFALNREILTMFTKIFTEHQVAKSYIAIVRGYVKEHEIIDYPLKNNVHGGSGAQQEAITEYHKLAEVELPLAVGRYATARYSLVKISLKTGRTHQIRRHFAHIRHPLIGDTMHGDGEHNRFFREHFACHRLLLMANELSFIHPVTGKAIELTVSLDDDFQQVLDAMGMKIPTPGNTEPQLGKKSTPGNTEPQLGEKEWYSRGFIPHRNKISLLQSITFRLADSLPQSKITKLAEKLGKLPRETYDLEKRKSIEQWLDSGAGCCTLGHPAMAKVMQETLLKFDGEKYRLIAWCIMPNHVHVLIEPYIPLGKIAQSWKSYTGRWALAHNVELGLGVPGKTFWMREFWDRFIRDKNHLKSVIEYIHNNPVKAGLCQTAQAWKWSSAYKQEV